jgi:hypothetical protein
MNFSCLRSTFSPARAKHGSKNPKKVFRIYVGGLFGFNYNLKMLYFCIILHDNFEDINIFIKKASWNLKVIKK